MDIYRRRSPFHARNVSLVFEKVTENVSPQFCVYFGPGFHTVKQDYFDSIWAVKSRLMGQMGKIGVQNYQENQNEGGKPQRDIKAKVKIQQPDQNTLKGVNIPSMTKTVQQL